MRHGDTGDVKYLVWATRTGARSSSRTTNPKRRKNVVASALLWRAPGVQLPRKKAPVQKLFNSKLAAALAVVGLGAIAPAMAASGTGNQYAPLNVAVTLTPDSATVGTVVTEVVTVTNTSKRNLQVTVNDTVLDPKLASTTYAQKAVLKAGQTASRTITYTVDSSYGPGVYYVTATATDGVGQSQATVSITVN
jgi:hypothetical protein